jgi:hypothetical protein
LKSENAAFSKRAPIDILKGFRSARVERRKIFENVRLDEWAVARAFSSFTFRTTTTSGGARAVHASCAWRTDRWAMAPEENSFGPLGEPAQRLLEDHLMPGPVSDDGESLP